MSGVLYAVGTGPGDPELMTLKAVSVLKSADVIAGPGDEAGPGLAFRIAGAAVPDIRGKEWLPIRFPMTKDPKQTAPAHDAAADRLIQILHEGRDIAFLTLGDPMIYSTFSYILERVRSRGFRVEVISGIPSFCAAAAASLSTLAAGDESILITSSAEEIETSDADTVIVMKAGSKLRILKEKAKASGRKIILAENCGMPGEKIYRGVDSVPDEAGYFSLLIASPSPQNKSAGYEKQSRTENR